MHSKWNTFAWWRHQMETFFRVTGLLCGEFTGPRWISLTKGSGAELWCFLWSVPEYTVVHTIVRLLIWDAIAPSWRHRNDIIYLAGFACHVQLQNPPRGQHQYMATFPTYTRILQDTHGLVGNGYCSHFPWDDSANCFWVTIWIISLHNAPYTTKSSVNLWNICGLICWYSFQSVGY